VSNFIKRNRRLVTAGVVALALVVLMSWTDRHRDRFSILERLLVDAISPVARVTSSSVQSAQSFLQGVVELGELSERNHLLEEELARLKSLQNTYEEALAENRRLRELLGLMERVSYPSLPARVTGRNPDNWFKMITIDRGSNAQVRVGMPVVAQGGLVGKIIKVSSRSATVLLLLDPESGVGARIRREVTYSPGPPDSAEEREFMLGDSGVVSGMIGDDGMLKLTFFSRDAQVIVGDTVVTSGLGDIFPPGLLIGAVVEVHREEFGLVKSATIRPEVDFAHLWEVLVVETAGDGDDTGDEPDPDNEPDAGGEGGP